jgi:hypothetical protein
MPTLNLNEDKYHYRPSPKQAIFHESDAREKLYGGAIGGGKTRALCEEALNLSLEFPEGRGVMVRRDGTDFNKTVLDDVLLGEVIDPRLIANHNQQRQRITFINGSKIYYGGAEKAELGFSLNWFAVDQAEEIEKKTYEHLLGRLRLVINGDKNTPHFALLAANPAPGWVKDRFIPPGGTTDVYCDGNKIYIPARPSENPGVTSDYEDRLREDHDEAWVRRYVDGDWTSFAGRVYQIDGEQIRPRSELYHPDARVYVAVDFGFRRAVVLWVQVRGECVIVIDELHTKNTTTGSLSRQCKAISDAKKYKVRSGYCDPAGAAKSIQTGISDISAFKKESGISLLFTTNKQLRDVAAGVRRLQSRIKTASGQRNLYVARECKQFLTCIENYCYPAEKNQQALKEEPLKDGVHDHSMDAIRYFEVGYFSGYGGKIKYG